MWGTIPDIEDRRIPPYRCFGLDESETLKKSSYSADYKDWLLVQLPELFCFPPLENKKEITLIWYSHKHSWVLSIKGISLVWLGWRASLGLPRAGHLVLPDPSDGSITLVTGQQYFRVHELFCFRKFCQLFNLRFHLLNDFLILPFNVLPHSFIFLLFYFM